MSSGFFSGRHFQFSKLAPQPQKCRNTVFLPNILIYHRIGPDIEYGDNGRVRFGWYHKVPLCFSCLGRGRQKNRGMESMSISADLDPRVEAGEGVGPHNGRLGELCWSRQTWSHPTLCRSSPSGRHTPNKTSLPNSLPERRDNDKIGLAIIRWRWSE